MASRAFLWSSFLWMRPATLRMRCVTQRCQAAPWNVSAIAFASPSWASETTRRTPSTPRALRPERNAFHPAWLSVSTQSTPTKRLWPVSSSPIAVTTAWDAERPSTRHFT